MVDAPSFSAVRRSVDELETPAQIAAAVGALSLVAAFTAFIAAPTYVAFPLAAFIAVVVYGWVTYQAETARALSLLTTVSTVIILGLITAYLFIQSVPVVRKMGLSIVTDTVWRTSTNRYGLLTMMWGTLVTTIIATLVSAPLGIAGAIFISELASDMVREVTKPAIELLAGIPSIVYGFIGFMVLNPYLSNELLLPTSGSLFLVGVMIGFMALPTVVSVAEDSLTAVPNSMKSGSVGLGATDWQTTKSVTLPAAISGISAAVILGVGRAVGETMAATVILGNVTRLPDPLYDVFGNTITLTSAIASQSGVAIGRPTQLSALFAAGVVLFVIVLTLSIVSQAIERRMARKLGGEQ
ncbi:phosphate ABC transporter, inner membrane subunit PstC [Haladaptatus paucihalophilus DX253]|uniref:Phosphate transport system permease protein n=1 Tax=Haladaptatus paucihalophilus DX253 TaxID=797209 RepID=E7R066_HALPU|nr:MULTISPECIES: phosphate ABC transporter permease subunit PstC [Haladaptatus]EFW89960.1 phosphate ABC transporter, inner membrane subunit PstC [Haladaptatus paucihalophilus DX253]GKZ12972.1 phosphate ABC transporter permease subunit PstC [Haladaptatus sp. T7]SHK59414.1 phosphate ABC transporter membrane protein 1, PhoT family [Haladaptatus paucihalophilus DX253]